MDPRFHVVTLGVSDLERSTRFYRDGLGLPLRDPPDEGISFFTTTNTWLSLFPRDKLAADAGMPGAGDGPPPEFPGFALGHLVRSRDLVDSVLREVEAAGGRIVKPAEETFWGGYAGYFADPDGFLWEVANGTNFGIE